MSTELPCLAHTVCIRVPFSPTRQLSKHLSFKPAVLIHFFFSLAYWRIQLARNLGIEVLTFSLFSSECLEILFSDLSVGCFISRRTVLSWGVRIAERKMARRSPMEEGERSNGDAVQKGKPGRCVQRWPVLLSSYHVAFLDRMESYLWIKRISAATPAWRWSDQLARPL